MKKNKKRKVLAYAIFLTALMDFCMGYSDGYNNAMENNEEITSSNIINNKEKKNSSKEINGISNNDEQITSYNKENASSSKEIIKISNNDELSIYLGYDDITFKKVRTAIRNNPNILNNYKISFLKIIDRLEEKTPNIDLRVLYANLKYLEKIEEINKEEMYERTGSNSVAGYFRADEHKIVLSKPIKDHYFSHETIHFLDHLVLQTENEVIKKESSKRLGHSLREGLTEWINIYLFPYTKYSYVEQVNDINIIKNILLKDDQELINNSTKYSYDYVLSELTNYIDYNKFEYLLSICDKEKDLVINYEDNPLLTSEEIEDKYDILVEAFISSRKGVLSDSEIFEFQQLLYSSFMYYLDNNYINNLENSNIVDYLKSKYEKKLIGYGNNSNNIIKIDMGNNNLLNYYDIDNLYMGYKKKDEYNYEITFIEEFLDSNNDIQYHISGPDSNISEYNFVQISDIISNMDIENNYLSAKDIFYYFYEYYITNDELEIQSKVYSYKR